MHTHTHYLTEVRKTGRAGNASLETDEETEAQTNGTIAQGHLTGGEAMTEATRTCALSIRARISSSTSRGMVPAAKITTLPTWAVVPGIKPPFLIWTLNDATAPTLRWETVRTQQADPLL